MPRESPERESKFLAQQGYGKVMYGLISDMFIYDVETGTSYRDSEPAKEALKTFYGVTVLPSRVISSVSVSGLKPR